MAEPDPFQGRLTPDQLAELAKAQSFDISYPVCLALRCMGLQHLEDHLHQVHVFELANGQMAFGFGWCSQSHVDPESFTDAERTGIRTIVHNVLEMKGFEVTEESGVLFVRKDGDLFAVGLPGQQQKDIEAEVERFRREIDSALGPPANKLPPDDPMSRWMP